MKWIRWTHLSVSLIVIAASSGLRAQQFQSPVYYGTGTRTSEPAPVIASDLNGDGKLDLIVGDMNQGGVAVYLGNGDGTFQSPTHTSVLSPGVLAAADLNQDGIPDLVVLQPLLGGRLMVFAGNGDGTFTPLAKYEIQDHPAGLVVGDFNGDGHLDVAVTSSNQGQSAAGYVTVLFGHGDGTLTRSARYRAGSHPWGIAAGDLNGDGHPDLVISDNNGSGGVTDTVFVLLNNGTGTFHIASHYPLGVEAVAVNIADLNHDGKPDLVVASAFDQSVGILLSHGDGTFSAPVFYATNAGAEAPQALVVADFDLDGNPDIALVNAVGNPGLLYGKGDGTFQSAAGITLKQPGGSGIAVGDFDRDGAPDLVVPEFSAGDIAVLINTQ